MGIIANNPGHAPGRVGSKKKEGLMVIYVGIHIILFIILFIACILGADETPSKTEINLNRVLDL
jgi:hypothetical protein